MGKIRENKIGCLVVWCHEQDNKKIWEISIQKLKLKWALGYRVSKLCACAHHMTCFGILKWRGPRRNRQTNSSIVALTPARSQQIQKWIPTERFRIPLQVGNYTKQRTSAELDRALKIVNTYKRELKSSTYF